MLGMPFNRTSVQVLMPHSAHAVLVVINSALSLESSGSTASERTEAVNMRILCFGI